MIGEKFFNLTPRDDVSQRFIAVCDRITTPSGAGTSQAVFNVPLGRVLVLHAMCATATPGGASAPQSLEFLIISAPGAPLRFLKRYNINNAASALDGRLTNNAALTLGVETSLDWTGELYIPQRSQVVAQAFWSGAGNTLSLDVHGVLIPYGNFTI